MGSTVRAITNGDGGLLRRARLAALADSPASFAASLAEEMKLPSAEWAARARGSPGEVVFVALDDGGGPLGLAGARPHHEDPDAIGLWGMWVAPAARGHGLGSELVATVDRWARGRGAARLRLGVMSDVPRAVGFYERLGFTRVQERRYVRDPARSWYLMTRPL